MSERLKALAQRYGVALHYQDARGNTVSTDLGVVAKLCDVVSVIFGGRILEEGSAETVFANPSHPYTSALIAASPRHDQPERGLHPIPPELITHLWEETAASDREYTDA